MFKMFGKLIKGIAAVVIALVVLGMVFGGGSSSESKKSDTAKEQAATEAAADTEEKKDDKKKDEAEEAAEEEPEEEAAPEEEEEVIEYVDVSVDDLTSLLDENPLKAKNTYEGTYIRLTGVLNNIDASGDYFTLNNGDEWSFASVMCYITDDAALDRIANASMGETLTVCGPVTSVGEIMGYQMDVDYIE